jgi:hypothetical protein
MKIKEIYETKTRQEVSWCILYSLILKLGNSMSNFTKVAIQNDSKSTNELNEFISIDSDNNHLTTCH